MGEQVAARFLKRYLDLRGTSRCGNTEVEDVP